VQPQLLSGEAHEEIAGKFQPVRRRTSSPSAFPPAVRMLAISIFQAAAGFAGSIVSCSICGRLHRLFAKRLDASCPIRVKQAQSGDLLVAGARSLLRATPPEGKETAARQRRLAGGRCRHERALSIGDVLFHSVAVEFGSQAMGVLMTGMGDDGAVAWRDPGSRGIHIAQSQETCVVFACQGGDRTWSVSGSRTFRICPIFADPVRTGSSHEMRKRSSGQPAPEVTRVTYPT